MTDMNLQIVISAVQKLTAPVRQAKAQLGNLEQSIDRVNRARERMNVNLTRAANMSLVGSAAQNMSGRINGMIGNVLQSVRQVDSARAELATLGMDNMDVILEKGKQLQGQWAGVTAASFTRAAYDIKSGISSLSDEGVASMTEAAAITAKATKASTEQMTSLFATSYGLFKRQYQDMSDQDFGGLFAASLSKSVQQFMTTGEKMQQAIQSAGAGAVNLGMDMREQLAVLGMMGTSMSGGESGTSLRAFTENAAKAHEAFLDLSTTGDNPISVRILDENGQLRQMPDILSDLKGRYGDTLDAFESQEIKQAFGTTEAVKLINALWGQEDALQANVKALVDASDSGLEFAKAMAAAANEGLDAQLKLLGQRKDLFLQEIGEVIGPQLNKILPIISNVLKSLEQWVAENPKLASGIAAVVLAVAGLAAVMAPVFMAMASLVGAWGVLNFGLVKSLVAIGQVIKIFQIFKLVLMANPIIAIAVGIALAAGMIYTYWEPISTFFAELWDGIEARFAGAFEFVRGIMDKVGGAVTWVKDALGFDGDGAQINVSNRAQRIAPASPMQTMAANRPSPPRGDVHQQIAISIQQQPGQDSRALADEVNRQLAERQRGALYDAPFGGIGAL